MASMSESQLLWMLLALGVLLLVARAGGEIARRIGQPEVLGELFGGFVLGPSVLGAAFPGVRSVLFEGPQASLVLNALAWIGAIFLLLIAGMEVDVAILRRHAGTTTLISAAAIIPSIGAGVLFVFFTQGKLNSSAFFLGTVLSVTAVTIAAKILLERDSTRRDYGQVILAAGITSEVVVWLLVSIESPTHGTSPALMAAERASLAVAFFAFVYFAGRRLVYWSMRRVGDFSLIANGPFTLIVVLTLLSAGLTQELGLHPLLGAFVFGVVLGQSPRTPPSLLGSVQALTIGFVAPIFFVLAGMRVDILQLGNWSTIAMLAALMIVATAVKVGFGTVATRVAHRPWPESGLIGFGLNLKGGTDVVVAIVGVTLKLLTSKLYTMYALVAIVTVLFSPMVMSRLEGRSPASSDEQERLEAEETESQAYTRKLERILVPVVPELQPQLTTAILKAIARSKNEREQAFDITSLALNGETVQKNKAEKQADEQLAQAEQLQEVELRRVQTEDRKSVLDRVVSEAGGYDLVAIGSPRCSGKKGSLGRLQEGILHRVEADVLIAVDPSGDFDPRQVRCVLVPLNGLEYSMAAGDLAASLAHTVNAELVAFHVVRSDLADFFWRDRDRRHLLNEATSIAEDLSYRVRRLGVNVQEKVEVSDRPEERIKQEIDSGKYDLVVMGTVVRGRAGHPYLGRTAQAVLTQSRTTSIVLVSKNSQT